MINTTLIFSYKEIDDQIIANTPTNSLVALSGVNRCAYLKLDNAFFQNRFFAEHPCLKEFADKNIFKSLKKFYPNYCWKTINYFWNITNRCWITATPYQCYSDKRYIVASNSMPASAINEALIIITEPLIEEKKQNEITIEQICGYGYEDPNSPIHQAYEAFALPNKIQHEHEQLRQERDELSDANKTINVMLMAANEPEIWDAKSKPYHSIFILKGRDGANDTKFEIEVNNQEITILKINDELLDPNEGVFTFINLLIKAQDEVNEENNNVRTKMNLLLNNQIQLKKKYQDLESRRVKCLERIEEIDTLFKIIEISEKLPSNKIPAQCTHSEYHILDTEYYMPIWFEFKDAIEAEGMTKLVPILQECSDLIQKIVSEKREATIDEQKAITDLIIACKDYKIKSFGDDDELPLNKKIWKEFSHTTKGPLFENLLLLDNIVKKHLVSAQKEKERASSNLNGPVSNTSPGSL